MLNCGFFWEFVVGSTYWGGLYIKGGRKVEESYSWFLETWRGLWRFLHRRYSLHYPDQQEWVTWKCRSAVVLPEERGTSFKLHQSRLSLNPRDKRLITHWITTDMLVVSRCFDKQTGWQCAEWRTRVELYGKHLIISVLNIKTFLKCMHCLTIYDSVLCS